MAPMPPLQVNRRSLARPSRRRWGWPIIIIAVAIPIAFISGRLESKRAQVAAEFGEKVAIWDGNPEVPAWLKDSVGHEILIYELSRRLKRRPSEATEYTVEASPEPEGDGSRWRVRLIWEDVPSLDMVLAFDGLDVDPRLVTVGAGPKPESESVPADDALVEGSVPDSGSELQ